MTTNANVQSAKNPRQMVVPNKYSALKPEVVPRRAERTICGSQKLLYTPVIMTNASAGETITRTKTVSATNMISPA